jgi:hypothetical protein
MKLKTIIPAVVLAFAFSGGASAALINVTGSGAIVTAPTSVLDDAADCTLAGNGCVMLGFDEQQGVSLGSALSVDGGGTIAAGTLVNSHMIFLNTPGTTRNESNATWLFDGIVLGVMSDRNGSLEAASNGELGASGTTYYGGTFGNRGFENSEDWYSGIGSSMLEVNMLVTEPGDWIRVVTAVNVPEPGTLALMGMGLLGLFGFRRNRNQSH